jgi:hypothetical protein
MNASLPTACLLAVAALACGPGCQPPASAPAQPVSTVTESIPPAVDEFRREAYGLDARRPVASRPAAESALRRMASALAVLPGDNAGAARRIEDEADRIAVAGPDASPTPEAHRALRIAVDTLAAAPTRSPELPRRLQAARTQIARIDRDAPYRGQRNAIDAAFVEVANAMVVVSTPRPLLVTPVAVRDVRVDRFLWNSVGRNPDVATEVCGPGGTLDVEHAYFSRDILAGVLTLGIYTPSHLRVRCRTARAASR